MSLLHSGAAWASGRLAVHRVSHGENELVWNEPVRSGVLAGLRVGILCARVDVYPAVNQIQQRMTR